MTVGHIFILIGIVVFVCDIFFNIDLFYNLNNNTGSIVVYLCKVPIFKGNIEIKQNILEIKRKKKSIKINLKLSEKQLEILKEFYKNISTKIVIDYVDLDLLICMENPFVCSIISGFIDILSVVLISIFQTKNFDTKVYRNISTGFRQDMITSKFKLGIYLSISDIIWSIIITLFSARRMVSEERRRKTKY